MSSAALPSHFPKNGSMDHFDDDLEFSVEEDSLLMESSRQTSSQSSLQHSHSSDSSSALPAGHAPKSDEGINVLGLTLADSPLESVESKQARAGKMKMTYLSLATLSAYWYGWSILWMPLLVILIPHQIVEIAGEEGKGSSLGMTLLLGSFCSLFCSPAFGAFSDHCRNPLGRRRPFMIVGTAIATVALFVMAIAKSLALFSFSFFILSIAMPMIMAPYSALIPDVVPEEQRGVTSGWLGAFSTLGFFCGGLITYKIDVLGVGGCYFVIVLIHALCAGVTIYYVPEVPLTDIPPEFNLMEFLRGFVKPFKSIDFRWLFFTRFLTQMGTVTVQEYLQFYVKDAIRVFEINGAVVADSPERAVSLLFLPLLAGAFVSSICAGLVSDYYGGRRKFLVYISGTLMALSALLFAVTRSFQFDVILGFVFGLGWGCFSAIDWAMATDVLPDADEFAKDMGVWSVAFVLPQVLAAPIAGNLLDYFEKVGPDVHLGYTIVFCLAVLYFIGGTYFIKFIEAVK